MIQIIRKGSTELLRNTCKKAHVTQRMMIRRGYPSTCNQTMSYVCSSSLKRSPKSHYKETIRQFSRNDRVKDELSFIVMRLAARGLGQMVGMLSRSGILRHTSKRTALLLLSTPIILAGGVFLINAERVPYSDRLHYLWLDRQTELELSENNRKAILIAEKDNLLTDQDEIYHVANRIVNNLLQVCEDDGIITSAQRSLFTIHIIKSKIPNAFVLPDGSIFIYTGIFPIAETEGGLACVLGHEISHALAHHASEKIGIIKMLILLYEFFKGLTDHTRKKFAREFMEFVGVTIFQIGIPLAHSRKMEMEADRIGLKIAARAGYNPDEAAAFWERMITFEKLTAGKKLQEMNNVDKNDQKKIDDDKQEILTEHQWTLVGTWNYWMGGDEKKATTRKDSKNHSHDHNNPAIIPSTTTASTSLTVSKHFRELFSTHPCHARRIEDLRVYAEMVRDDYRQSIDKLRWSNKSIPLSKKYLPYEGVKKSEETPFDYDYGWEETDFYSAQLATNASALMIGEQGDIIREFLKAIGRADKPWGTK